MSRHAVYDDDDGRSIADMSGVERPNLLGVRRKSETREQGETPEKPAWADPAASMPNSERRAFIWGALSAALLIALVFIAGLGLVILLITLLR